MKKSFIFFQKDLFTSLLLLDLVFPFEFTVAILLPINVNATLSCLDVWLYHRSLQELGVLSNILAAFSKALYRHCGDLLTWFRSTLSSSLDHFFLVPIYGKIKNSLSCRVLKKQAICHL